jgi:hypothetical protein
MIPIPRLLSRWLDDPWPDAKPLPPHVAAVRLDQKLLLLHMQRAANPPPPEKKTP